MTRVSTAAAITLQTWSRTVLAKKEAYALEEEQKMKQLKAKSLESYEGTVSIEVFARRFLLVAACIALVGITTQTSGPEMLATSPAKDSSSPTKMFQVVAGSIPSLLYARRGWEASVVSARHGSLEESDDSISNCGGKTLSTHSLVERREEVD